MTIDAIRAHCLAKPGVTECFPFDETTLVFKVLDKMFLLAGLDNVPLSINFKSTPEVALELRERYESVAPGFHQNKKYWNTATLDGSVRDALIREWIDGSYSEVVAGMSGTKRKLLQ